MLKPSGLAITMENIAAQVQYGSCRAQAAAQVAAEADDRRLRAALSQ